MARRGVDIRQVADRAGVSIGTVSNVLNRPELVADATRAAVHVAIDELGYVRNGSAARLRLAQSEIVGLVVLDAANPFFAEMARGAEEALETEGYTVVLCNSDGSLARQERHLRFLDEQRVAGVLITPVDPGHSEMMIDQVRTHGLSVVLVDEPADDAVSCSVSVDDVRGGELAGEHLVDIGGRRIVFVAGPESVRQSEDRLAGLRRVVDSTPGVDLEIVRVAGLNAQGGYGSTDEILGHEPDSVFCVNDLVALGVLRGLFERGCSIPDDVALVGFDDIEFAGMAAVPLTSIRQPAAEMGAAAATLLVEEYRRPEEHSHRCVTFGPRLIVRQSTSRR